MKRKSPTTASSTRRKPKAAESGAAETGDEAEDPRFSALLRQLSRDAAIASSVADYRAARASGDAKFGDQALKVDGKIFAMMTRGQLVVKLPRARVDELVAAGDGARFTTGGRTMKEWLVVVDPSLPWLALVRAAHAFVSAR